MDEDEYITTKYLCKCGSNLALINDNEFYDDDIAQCDQCLDDIPRNEAFFHCKENVNSAQIHLDGYDLCKKCVLSNDTIVTNVNDNESDDEDEENNILLISSPTIATRKEKKDKCKSRKKAKRDKKEKKEKREKKDKNDDSNSNKKLKKEKLLLMKEIQDKNNKIKYLENQLELIKKDKLENDTTLKLVKNQVNELILKNEELNRELIIQQKQNAKFQPDAQWKLLCQLQTNFKSLKSKQSKEGKQIEHNCKKIKKMEEILANMYQVFNNKFEKQEIEIRKSSHISNLQLDDIDKELSELEREHTLSAQNSDS